MSSFVTNNVNTINILFNKDLEQLEIVHNRKFENNTLFTVCPLIPGVTDYYLIHDNEIVPADSANRFPISMSEEQYKRWEKKSMTSILPFCLAEDYLQDGLSELLKHAAESGQRKGKYGQHRFSIRKDRRNNKYYKLKYKYGRRYIVGRVYGYEDETLFYTDYYTFITN